MTGRQNSIQKLETIAKDNGCKDAYLIEDSEKIDWEKLNKVNSIGLTSGASAPEHLVEGVLGAIKERFQTNIISDQLRKETIEFKVPPILR